MATLQNGSHTFMPPLTTCSSTTSGSVPSSVAKRRARCFHRKYVDTCKKRNAAPIVEIKEKVKNVLDFAADRVKLDDWPSIMKALMADDGALRGLGIRLRKAYTHVIDKVDSEKKCRALKTDPAVCTKFIFSPLIGIVAGVIRSNSNIDSLILEGLPMANKFTQCLTEALLQNTSLRTISLARSNISDEGCAMVCATIKHLPNVEQINFSGCFLSVKGADSVANLLKYQKILRFTEAWNQSLRYRDVDADKIPGLKFVCLNQNPDIGDEGLNGLLAVLKEDEWIKSLEMQHCGLTDAGGRAIVECLDYNKTLMVFDVRNNAAITNATMNLIRKQFGMEPEVQEARSSGSKMSAKVKAVQSMERIAYLEQQLDIEMQIRKQAEALNEQLHTQMLECQREMEDVVIKCNSVSTIPDNCSLVSKEELKCLLQEVEELRANSSTMSQSSHTLTALSTAHTYKASISSVRKAKSMTTPTPNEESAAGRSKESKSDSKIRKQQQQQQQQQHQDERREVRRETPRVTYVEREIGDSITVGHQQYHIQPLPVMANYIVAGGGDQVKAKPQKNDRNMPTYSNPSSFFAKPSSHGQPDASDDDNDDDDDYKDDQD